MEDRELTLLLRIVDATEGIDSIAKFRSALALAEEKDALFQATMEALRNHGIGRISGAVGSAMPYFTARQRELVLAALLL